MSEQPIGQLERLDVNKDGSIDLLELEEALHYSTPEEMEEISQELNNRLDDIGSSADKSLKESYISSVANAKKDLNIGRTFADTLRLMPDYQVNALLLTAKLYLGYDVDFSKGKEGNLSILAAVLSTGVNYGSIDKATEKSELQQMADKFKIPEAKLGQIGEYEKFFGLDVSNALKKYDTYIQTELEGKLTPDIIDKIYSSIGKRLLNLEKVVSDLKQEEVEKNGNLDNFENAKWIVNSRMGEDMKFVNDQLLPSATLYAHFGKEGDYGIVGKGGKGRLGMLTKYSREGDMVGLSFTGIDDRIEEIQEMFKSNVDLEGNFDEGLLSTQNIYDASDEAQLRHYTHGKKIESVKGVTILNESNEKIDKNAMMSMLAVMVVWMGGEISTGPLGVLAGVGYNAVDFFRDEDLALSIARQIPGVDIPDSYRMEKTFIDDLMALIGIIPGLSPAMKLAKSSKVALKYGIKMSDVNGLGKAMIGDQKAISNIERVVNNKSGLDVIEATRNVDKINYQHLDSLIDSELGSTLTISSGSDTITLKKISHNKVEIEGATGYLGNLNGKHFVEDDIHFQDGQLQLGQNGKIKVSIDNIQLNKLEKAESLELKSYSVDGYEDKLDSILVDNVKPGESVKIVSENNTYIFQKKADNSFDLFSSSNETFEPHYKTRNGYLNFENGKLDFVVIGMEENKDILGMKPKEVLIGKLSNKNHFIFDKPNVLEVLDNASVKEKGPKIEQLRLMLSETDRTEPSDELLEKLFQVHEGKIDLKDGNGVTSEVFEHGIGDLRKKIKVAEDLGILSDTPDADHITRAELRNLFDRGGLGSLGDTILGTPTPSSAGGGDSIGDARKIVNETFGRHDYLADKPNHPLNLEANDLRTEQLRAMERLLETASPELRANLFKQQFSNFIDTLVDSAEKVNIPLDEAKRIAETAKASMDRIIDNPAFSTDSLKVIADVKEAITSNLSGSNLRSLTHILEAVETSASIPHNPRIANFLENNFPGVSQTELMTQVAVFHDLIKNTLPTQVVQFIPGIDNFAILKGGQLSSHQLESANYLRGFANQPDSQIYKAIAGFLDAKGIKTSETTKFMETMAKTIEGHAGNTEFIQVDTARGMNNLLQNIAGEFNGIEGLIQTKQKAGDFLSSLVDKGQISADKMNEILAITKEARNPAEAVEVVQKSLAREYLLNNVGKDIPFDELNLSELKGLCDVLSKQADRRADIGRLLDSGEVSRKAMTDIVGDKVDLLGANETLINKYLHTRGLPDEAMEAMRYDFNMNDVVGYADPKSEGFTKLIFFNSLPELISSPMNSTLSVITELRIRFEKTGEVIYDQMANRAMDNVISLQNAYNEKLASPLGKAPDYIQALGGNTFGEAYEGAQKLPKDHPDNPKILSYFQNQFKDMCANTKTVSIYPEGAEAMKGMDSAVARGMDNVADSVVNVTSARRFDSAGGDYSHVFNEVDKALETIKPGQRPPENLVRMIAGIDDNMVRMEVAKRLLGRNVSTELADKLLRVHEAGENGVYNLNRQDLRAKIDVSNTLELIGDGPNQITKQERKMLMDWGVLGKSNELNDLIVGRKINDLQIIGGMWAKVRLNDRFSELIGEKIGTFGSETMGAIVTKAIQSGDWTEVLRVYTKPENVDKGTLDMLEQVANELGLPELSQRLDSIKQAQKGSDEIVSTTRVTEPAVESASTVARLSDADIYNFSSMEYRQSKAGELGLISWDELGDIWVDTIDDDLNTLINYSWQTYKDGGDWKESYLALFQQANFPNGISLEDLQKLNILPPG